MIDADRSGPPLNNGSVKRFADLKAEWDARRQEMGGILDEVREFNTMAQQQTFPPIAIPAESGSPRKPTGARDP
jgi:hypothetical protein